MTAYHASSTAHGLVLSGRRGQMGGDIAHSHVAVKSCTLKLARNQHMLSGG